MTIVALLLLPLAKLLKTLWHDTLNVDLPRVELGTNGLKVRLRRYFFAM
jgi:hypothetical protein